MFGMQNIESGGHYAGGHGRHGRHGRRHHGSGHGGRHGQSGGMGGDDIRSSRMLAQGDLTLILLALIAEEPRHGYEIIKVIEDKTEGGYAPSPGIVYPTLTYLEEAGYLTAQVEGTKKLYTITGEGRAYLETNRDIAGMVLDRLIAVGTRFARSRRRAEEGADDRRFAKLPPLVRAALENLRVAASERLDRDSDAEPKIVNVLALAGAELRRI